MASKIRILEPELINRIAAGEVIERPASVVKELLENALDAGATTVHLTVKNGGHTLIRLQDDGCGMNAEELNLCVQRHTTSKLSESDLWNIHTFGFRGEALASITSIARANVSSKCEEDPHGWTLRIEGGIDYGVKPENCDRGTCIEITDLFFSTPARLKFLRSPTQEYLQLNRLLERFLILYPQVNFFIQLDEKIKRFYRTLFNERVAQIFKCTVSDGFNVDGCKNDITVSGWCGLPGIHRRSADHILLYANGRPIEDKMLLQAVRFAYQDTIPKDRFPCLVLFLNLPHEDIDVNVHPAKIHVRFKDPQEIRQAVVTIVRSALIEHGKKTAFTDTGAVPSLAHAGSVSNLSTDLSTDTETLEAVKPFTAYAPPPPTAQHFHRGYDRPIKKLQAQESIPIPPLTQRTLPVIELQATRAQDLDLGYAIGQVHQRYILAENAQGLVIVDPHGAHERVLYERMKSQWTSEDVQLLIPPLPLTLTESEYLKVTLHQAALSEVGFLLEIKDSMYYLTGVPAVLHEQSPHALWESVLTLLQTNEESTPLEIRQTLVHRILAYWSCRKSVFLGDALSLEEMNALLRMMEQTPNAAQCNHGRNVYRVFSLTQLATWFDRH